MKWLRFSVVCALILGIDFASKIYVHTHIPYLGFGARTFPYGGIALFQGVFGGIDCSINHVHNTGAAWGVFSSFQTVLLVLRMAVILGLIVYFFVGNRVKAREIPLLCVIGGAIGNVLDYFAYGYVVDFVYVRLWGYSYPLFNVADSVIFCGIAVLMVQGLLGRTKKEKVRVD